MDFGGEAHKNSDLKFGVDFWVDFSSFFFKISGASKCELVLFKAQLGDAFLELF